MFCTERAIFHYVIDPGKPAQNGAVERSHGEDNKRLYYRIYPTIRSLKRALRIWNKEYNNLKYFHLGDRTLMKRYMEKPQNSLNTTTVSQITH